MREGVLVTVNSDDPAYFGGYMSENFSALARHAQLGVDELQRLAANSFRAAWLTTGARERLLAELDDYCATATRR